MIIQHAKLVCSCERISWIFIPWECVIGVLETERNWQIKLTDWSMAGNLSNRSSGVQTPRDICTRLKRYLYSAMCSWIIKPNTLPVIVKIMHAGMRPLNYSLSCFCCLSDWHGWMFCLRCLWILKTEIKPFKTFLSKTNKQTDKQTNKQTE